MVNLSHSQTHTRRKLPENGGEVINLQDHIPQAEPQKEDKIVAVIDIGSKHVNTAIYNGHTLDLIVKRKAPADLAKDTRKGHRAIREDKIRLAEQELRMVRPLLKVAHDVRIVATSAIRLVAHTKAGKEIIRRLEQASGGHKIRTISGKREAIYIGKIILAEFAKTLKAPNIKSDKTKRAFIAIGGGSIQTGRLENGQVKNPESIPYGIHIQIAESGDKLKRAATLLRSALKPIQYGKIDELYASGGNWRDIAEVILARGKCKPIDPTSSGPVTLSWDEAKKELTAISKMKQNDFAHLALEIRGQKEIMYGAKTLLIAMEHFRAKKLIICKSNMRESIAQDETFHSANRRQSRQPSPPSRSAQARPV